MKKSRLFMLLALITLTLALLSLGGCQKRDNVASISLKDYSAESVIETSIGGFDYNSHKLVVTYDSGKTEEIALTEAMIADADVFKFYQPGEHEITVSYKQKTCTFKVSVIRGTLGNISFPENNVFTYNGKAHTVEVEGEMPANAVVTYPGGNSFVNAGTYDVTAIITCEGYVTRSASTTVTIERANYDMSGVKFESKEFVYDGKAHTIEISGTLPAGLSKPTYYINGNKTSSAVDAGEYEVTAVFANTDKNYNSVSNMKAKITITPAEYSIEGAEIVFKNEKGNLLANSNKVYDGASVYFDLNDKSYLSNKLAVSFSVYDENETLLTNEKGASITSFKNAGTYTVKAEFTFLDTKNYQPIDPIEAVFTIEKAVYDVSDIDFYHGFATYDGNKHTLSLDIPKGNVFKPEDIRYEYYLNGELQSTDGVANAGEYEVRAIFIVRDTNYADVPYMDAWLTIEKKTIDISTLGFASNSVVINSGEKIEDKFKTASGEPLVYETKIYKADGDTLTEVTELEAGVIYKCVITVTVSPELSANCVMSGGRVSAEFSCNFIVENGTDA